MLRGLGMNPFRFHVPTRIIFEVGAVHFLGEMLKDEGINAAMVITDKGVLGAGCLEPVFSSLDKYGIVHEIYDGVKQNPTERNVEEALAFLKSGSFDAILAVGGGSSLDTAKAVLALLKEGRNIRDLYQGVLRGKPPIPLIAVPTTAGTGSEVTWSAVITNEEARVKETIRGEYMYPKMAVVDPELTITLPEKITASTGMDALTHALEAFISKKAHALSDGLAMEAAYLIFNNLRNAVDNGQDIQARSAMSIASTLAGMAFSISGLGMVHGLAEPLGGRYNVPHGIANSILLPHCLSFNCDAVEEKLAILARLLGLDGKRDFHEVSHSLVDEVIRLADDVGIPGKLDITLDEEEFNALVNDALKNSCLPANPKNVKREDIQAIYSRILHVER